MRAVAIAANTFREALRERLLYNLVVFAALLTAGSLTVSQLTLGDQFRIIADVATGSTQVFGSLIAVFLGVGLVTREVERRTCYAVLARPVSRAGFVVGKYLGLLAMLGLNVLFMAAVSVAVLALHRQGLGFLGAGFVYAFALLLVQFAVCLGFAVLFSTFTTSTLATIFTLTLVGSGHLFAEVRNFWLRSKEVQLKLLARVLDFVLPNLGLLDLKEAVTYSDPVSLASFLTRLAYGAAYAAVLVALAALIFTRRDVR